MRAFMSDRGEREGMIWAHYRTFNPNAGGPLALWRKAYRDSLGDAGSLELERIISEAEPYRAVPVGHGLLPYMPEGREATQALTEALTDILPELDRLAREAR